MAIAEAMLAEFEVQAPVTRRFLSACRKISWDGSRTTNPCPPGSSPTIWPLCRAASSASCRTIRRKLQSLSIFRSPRAARRSSRRWRKASRRCGAVLPKFDDAAMSETWRMVGGGREVMAQPRAESLRDLMLSHWYQHRGQFSVYLRMLDVAVPASWGPSGDEPPAFVRKGSIGLVVWRLGGAYVSCVHSGDGNADHIGGFSGRSGGGVGEQAPLERNREEAVLANKLHWKEIAKKMFRR